MRTSGNNQQKILDFINSEIEDKGYPPSVREICAATGLHSTASAYYQLKALAKEGRIRLDESKKRAISLIDPPQEGKIPVVGLVTAGLPILATENIEGYLSWEEDPDCFALRVRGDSMIGAGILSGDRVIVHPQPTAENGDIVVALLGDEATVKRLSISENGVWLLPENPAYEPIDAREASILGRVCGLVRTF